MSVVNTQTLEEVEQTLLWRRARMGAAFSTQQQ
jgi:hypothetical protein